MSSRSKLLIAAIGAIVLLGMAVNAASARNIAISNWEFGHRIVWSDLKIEAGGREADCPVTLEGTWETHTFAKLSGTRVGRITEARVGTCIRGAATFLRETLPWEVTYAAFTGTLPDFTSVKLKVPGVSYRVNIEGIECLARTEVNHPFSGIASVTSGEVRTFEAERNAGIETSGGFFCFISGASHFSGAGAASVRGGTSTIRISLI